MKYADLATFKHALELAQGGHKKDAYAQLQTLIPMYPDDPRVLLGIVYTATSLPEAEKALARATALAPYNTNIYAANMWLANERDTGEAQAIARADQTTPGWTSLSAWLVDRDEIVEPYSPPDISFPTSTRRNWLPMITWGIVATLMLALIALAVIVVGTSAQPATATTTNKGVYAGKLAVLNKVILSWDTITSYKASISGNDATTGSINGTMTFVKPDRYKFAIATQGEETRMIIIGSHVYLDRQRFWAQEDVSQMDNVQAMLAHMNLTPADMLQQFAESTITLGTDTLDGKPVGTVSIDTTSATYLPAEVARGTKLNFSYDSATFRTLQERVTTAHIDTTLRFFDYNTADNVVEIP